MFSRCSRLVYAREKIVQIICSRHGLEALVNSDETYGISDSGGAFGETHFVACSYYNGTRFPTLVKVDRHENTGRKLRKFES